MKKQVKRFLLTLGFMTRIPVTVDLGEVRDEDMHKGFLYYPVVGLIMSIVVRLVIGAEAAEISVGQGGIFMGIIVLCLTQYFVYGAELEKDVDGLL